MASSTWENSLGGMRPPPGLDNLLGDAQAVLRLRATAAVRAPPHAQTGWKRFHSLASRLIRRTLTRRGVWRADLDDQAEEVWIELIRKLPDFQPRRPGSAAAFIRKIARDRAAQFWRKAERWKEIPAELAFLDAMPGADGDPSAIVAKREDVANFRQALVSVKGSLSPKRRDVLRLCLLEKRPATEVARLIDASEGYVWDAAWRIRQQLRAEIEGQDPEGSFPR